MKRFYSFILFCLLFLLAAQLSLLAESCAEERRVVSEEASSTDDKNQADRFLLETQLERFLDKNDVETLLNKKQLFRSVYNAKNMEPLMIPPFPIPNVLTQQWKNKNPACLIESIYLYKKKFEKNRNVQKVSHVLRSISRLKGLEYYSSSRKKMRTLYESSYVIDSPATKIRQNDPVNMKEQDFSVYALQKDLTFGENVYRYRFISDDNSSGFISVNTDTLKYSVFKAVMPEDLQVSIAVTDLGGYLLIHGLTRVDFASLPIFRKRVQNSFKTRGDAVLRWFIEQYEERIE